MIGGPRGKEGDSAALLESDGTGQEKRGGCSGGQGARLG